MFHSRLKMLLETFILKDETFVSFKLHTEKQSVSDIQHILPFLLLRNIHELPFATQFHKTLALPYRLQPPSLKETVVPAFSANSSMPVCETSG